MPLAACRQGNDGLAEAEPSGRGPRLKRVDERARHQGPLDEILRAPMAALKVIIQGATLATSEGPSPPRARYRGPPYAQALTAARRLIPHGESFA